MKEREELKVNNWIENPERINEFNKDRFKLYLSDKNYIFITDGINTRYYGIFPNNNLELIEKLVCW